MARDLLDYYNDELRALRQAGAEFASAHPDIASEIQLDGDKARDPYVERMLEGFAYLTARVRKKLDDGFPEFAETFLGQVYPHYVAPIPSMAVAQFALRQSEAGLVEGHPIPRGTLLESNEVEATREVCTYQTCYPLTLLPIEVDEAALTGLDNVPFRGSRSDAVAAIRLRLVTFNGESALRDMKVDRLRFFVDAEDAPTANAIYDLLFRQVVDLAVVGGAQGAVFRLSPAAISSVGFDRTEAVLPVERRGFDGYRLLSEFFALPEKFRFFDITLPAHVVRQLESSVEIILVLKANPASLQRKVSKENFQLGCTPVVNLFPVRAEPMTVDHTQYEHHVIPDARRSSTMEVYSVDTVSRYQGDESQEVYPLYSLRHGSVASDQVAFYLARRRAAGYRDGRRDPGTEVFLSLADLEADGATEEGEFQLEVELTCLNRDLPRQIRVRRGGADLHRKEGGVVPSGAFRVAPTPTRRRGLADAAAWKLVSHLSLNHLGLVDGVDGAESLRELLRLYEPVGDRDVLAKIGAIRSVRGQRCADRIQLEGVSGFARGVEVTIDFDLDRFADHSLMLFANVLERFLGTYCSVNSFVRLQIRTASDGEVLNKWPPRSGHKRLL